MSKAPKTLQHRSRKGRANARSFRNIESTEITDEVALSLIETFPASDPPAWISLARVGVPSRQKSARPLEKHDISD
jgi:hypothetical protein